MKTCTAAILLSVLLPFQACSDGKSSKGLKFAELSNDSLFSIGSALLRDPLTADSAIICFAILADRFEKSPRSGGNQELHAKALTNLGYLFSNFRSDYPKAYSYLADALDICKKNGYKSIEPYICLDIGVAIEAYGSLRQNHSDTDSLCEKYLVQAMEMSEKNGEWRSYMFAFHNLATIYAARADKTATKTLLGSYIRTKAFRQGSTIALYSDEVARGLGLWTAGFPLKGAEVFSKLASTDILEELQNQKLQYSALGLCADMYDAAGLTSKADSVLAECAHRIESAGDAESRKWISSVLYQRYNERGDSTLSSEWEMKLYRARDEIYNQSTLTGFKGLEFISRMRGIQREAAKEREQKKRMQTTLAVLGVLTAIALILLSLYIRHLSKRRRQTLSLYREAMEQIALRRNTVRKDIDPDLIRRITDTIANSESVLQPDFSLDILAREVGSNTSYVSHALNTNFGQSFSMLVARRRIDEACLLLGSRQYDKLTVEAIAEKVGIRSRSNFTSSFKRITGMTPGEFRAASQSGKTVEEQC